MAIDKPFTDSRSVRRLVTGHDSSGHSVFLSDKTFDPVLAESGDAAMCMLWYEPKTPIDNSTVTGDIDQQPALTLKGGSVLMITEMFPRQSSPFHRTNSMDYGIVIAGTVEIELDNGAVSRLHPGDVIIQRGTIHLWRNPSDSEVCRIAFVLTEASSGAVVNGTPLPEVLP